MKYIFLLLIGPASAQAAQTNVVLDQKIQTFVEHSLPRLACNLSLGSPGSIIAAPAHDDPDYYFHWVRDSGMIVQSLSRLLPFEKGTPNEARIRKFISDFSRFSETLQNSPAPFGAGEPRFNIDGSIDTSPWPRPQYDGLALRSMALMDYLTRNGQGVDKATTSQMERVIRSDLNNIVTFHNTKGFDLWEYANGFDFFTRMVQTGALVKGTRYFAKSADPRWTAAAQELRTQLENHWHPQAGIIGADLTAGPSINWMGNPIKDDGTVFNTAVGLAVIHGDLPDGAYSDIDERVWSSLWVQENFALTTFPFNADKPLGPGIGRGPGDDYYGGNMFFFISASHGEHSFRLAQRLLQPGAPLVASEFRLPVLQHVFNKSVKAGRTFRLPNPALAQSFALEGEAFLTTMLDVIPADGAMYEQFSKVDGSPASAKDLSWSYGSLLTAILEREFWHRSGVDYTKLNFLCPTSTLSQR